LEKQVAPLFYQRTSDGIPQVWCQMMRSSIRDLMPRFSSHRMVLEYYHNYYVPSSRRFQNLTRDNFAAAQDQAEWRNKLMTTWSQVAIQSISSNADGGQKTVGESMEFEARVVLGGLTPEDVTVEAYYGPLDHMGEFTGRHTLDLEPIRDQGGGAWLFKNSVTCRTTGKFGYTVRVTPSQKRLANPFVTGLICWA
jgi:starch phosphorylase